MAVGRRSHKSRPRGWSWCLYSTPVSLHIAKALTVCPYGSGSGPLDHGPGPFDGRPRVTQVPGDLVTDGPLSFRHCGGMTEGRSEERRVGKEGRSWWAPCHFKK